MDVIWRTTYYEAGELFTLIFLHLLVLSGRSSHDPHNFAKMDFAVQPPFHFDFFSRVSA